MHLYSAGQGHKELYNSGSTAVTAWMYLVSGLVIMFSHL